MLFDLDGVVTNTASAHAAAWTELFDPILTSRGLPPFDPINDYLEYLDGQTREDGILRFLSSRGITVPTGDPRDPAEVWSIFGLARKKNELFLARIATDGVGVFPATASLLQRLRAGRVPVGLVSASRNAHAVMAAAGVDDMFDTVIDGHVVELQHLSGKPDPAMFIEATHRLGVTAEKTAVIEDAIAGVEAGRRGGFGLVVGVDRLGQREALEAAGADIVVDDVGELDLGESRVHPWKLVYEGFDPAHEGHREALTALGNGYLATRGTSPEAHDDGVHYPATYLAGVYNTAESVVHGRAVREEQLVNVPNWLPLDIRIGADGWWSADSYSTTAERRELDLRTGVLTRSLVLTTEQGERLAVVQRRFTSMDDPHLAVLQTTATPIGFSGTLTIRAGVDGGVRNSNVLRDKGHGSSHLTQFASTRLSDGDALIESVTSASGIRIAMALRTAVSGATPEQVTARTAARRYQQQFQLRVRDGDPVVITKTVAVVTSRDSAITSPAEGAVAVLRRTSGDIDELLGRHENAWRRLWSRFAIDIDADKQCQLVLNLHMFHTLQTISPHTAALDAGVPARGLHGEGYRGHVFWDELFVIPVIGHRLPHVSRALLEYRWRRLPAAREIARIEGATGACFPWQSAGDGTEQTPTAGYNPLSGRWVADHSALQKHVGLAVAYDVWHHFQLTGDLSWLAERGAELIIEVARYFASLVVHRSGDERAHIFGVMGPDEYHDGYPDAPGMGLRDNTYTNVLAAWTWERALDSLAVLEGHAAEAIRERLAVDDGELDRWRVLSTSLAVPFSPDGLLDQFEGFHRLEEFDWEGYRLRYQDLGRIDLILESEGDTSLRYKVTKQPDVLMLLYLLGREGLQRQLARLRYPLPSDDLDRTVEFYLKRTVHGSTLSRVANAAILTEFDPARAWSVYRAALVADLDDTQGGTTSEGIHLGAMAGTAGLTVHSFAGLRTEQNSLRLSPRLPSRIKRLRFEVWYRGHRVDVTVEGAGADVSLHRSTAPPVRIVVDGAVKVMGGGDAHRFRLRPARDEGP
ncbi:HAD-IA family hydrolase [Ruicaihuangia caeni]|uniref:HAD-IA family hydrolase n=1 Tax=Ruicaihuangia caeni TaxID=3042517 RepID=A0AAW6T1D2_9MICO|nr:HAD-IA family hydrolase [Klugiella sp. YN-L-19]MDI2097640.1 HAD-IA family hydrolase [Klugiella sp. YN-L-19]